MAKSCRKPGRRPLVSGGDSSSGSDRGLRKQRHCPSDDRIPPALRDSDGDRKPPAPKDDDDDSDGAPDSGTVHVTENDLSMQQHHRQQSNRRTRDSRRPHLTMR